MPQVFNYFVVSAGVEMTVFEETVHDSQRVQCTLYIVYTIHIHIQKHACVILFPMIAFVHLEAHAKNDALRAILSEKKLHSLTLYRKNNMRTLWPNIMYEQ